MAQSSALRGRKEKTTARILLIDAAASVAAGKALDLQQSAAVERFHTRLTGTDDMTAVTGVSNMSQLHVTDTTQGALIAFGNDTILLQGVAANTVTASDFHFHI